MISKLKIAIVSQKGESTADMLRGDIKATDILKPSEISKKLNARNTIRDLEKLERDHIDQLLEGKQIGTANEMSSRPIFRFLEEGEGRVFQDLMDAIQSGDTVLKEKYRGQNKQNYINKVIDAASEWGNIQTQSRRHLTNGVENLKSIIKEKYPYSDKYVDKMVTEYDKVIKHLKSYEKGGSRENEGYVPHYLLDIISDNVAFAEEFSKDIGRPEAQTLIGDFANKLERINTNLSQRLKERSGSANEYFSRNPMLYAAKYIEEVISFNHRTAIDKTYVKGLKDLTRAVFRDPERPESKAAKVYLDIFNEMRGTALGTEQIYKAGAGNNISRLLTSLQFTSKLGFSTTGAIRNAGQRLWNWIYWGTRRQADAWTAYNGDDVYKSAMETELNRRGLMFTDISKVTDGALNVSDLLTYGIDVESGYITRRQTKNLTERWLEKANIGVGKFAEASSVLTKWAENSNRKSTFKLGFHERAKQLKSTKEFANWGTDQAIADRLYRKAGSYASRMTSMIHFEYSPIGKPKIFREGVGKVLGQFQHYAFSVAELQWNLVKSYGRAIKAGDYTGPELGRIVRLVSLYAITDLVGGYFNIGLSSYINNDTLNKAQDLTDLLTGDEEESKRAFFGKGAVGALGLVPISDMVELHNMGAAAGYWNMLADEDSTVGWLLGMREGDADNNISRISIDRIASGRASFGTEALKFGSIQAHRLVTKTWPATSSSQNLLGNVIHAELGLYPGQNNILPGKTKDIHRWFREETPFLKERASRRYRRANRSPYRTNYRASYSGKYDTLSQRERDRALRSLRTLG